MQQNRLHRATWVQTELLLTFPPPLLKAISVIPLNAEETAGRFRVWLAMDSDDSEQPSWHILIWDRKLEGGFPELKVLVSAKKLTHRPVSCPDSSASLETTYS